DMDDEFELRLHPAELAAIDGLGAKPMNSDQIEKQAQRAREQRWFNTLAAYFPHLAQDYEFHSRMMWRLRDGDAMVAPDLAAEPHERLLTDREAVAIVEQPGNCDEMWLRAANQPTIVIPPGAAAEVKYAWEDLPPIARDLLRVADRAGGESRALLMEL